MVFSCRSRMQNSPCGNGASNVNRAHTYLSSSKLIAFSPPPSMATAATALHFSPRPSNRLHLRPSTALLPSSSLQCRPHRGIDLGLSALASARPPVETTAASLRLTYLEANSWLWELEGMNLLVDPILVGNLDFGLPWLFDGAKRFVKKFQLEDLPEIDCLLITQGLDDHCHIKTLRPLSQMRPNLQVIAASSAKAILSSLFSKVTYLDPGQSFELQGKNGRKLNIRATAGPVLGPPWQQPENGYLVSIEESKLSLYYEPHCVCDQSLLEKERADVVITPVVKQLLPSFTLVSGQEDAVNLAKTLQAKFVVPMSNGNLDTKGILSHILRKEGTLDSFKQLLFSEAPGVQVLEPAPGVPLEIPVNSIIS